MAHSTRAREIFDIEIDGLRQVRDALGAEFNASVELILEQLRGGGKLVVTGLGKSFHIGQKIAATCTSTGTPAVVLHPSEAMHGDLGLIHDGDVLLALSFSGESDELVTLLPLVKRCGAKIVAITQQVENTIARLSDLVIPVPVTREACPFNMAPTTSTTATLAVGDALAMVLLEARGFEKGDYAKLHPAGAIGRALLLRVGDFMRTGERLAWVPSGARVKEAVMAITGARAGAAAIVGSDNKVLGIFTDGDLRRHMANDTDLKETLVDEVMTTDPITIRQDDLAIDVLSLYRTHNINSLIVVDESRQLVGMVDIQDLPKLKIL